MSSGASIDRAVQFHPMREKGSPSKNQGLKQNWSECSIDPTNLDQNYLEILVGTERTSCGLHSG